MNRTAGFDHILQPASPRRHGIGIAVALFLFGSATAVLAQTADRDRSRMLQMQQQIQHLQSDNSAMQQERAQLQDRAKQTDELKKAAVSRGKELANSQSALKNANRENERLQGELDALRKQDEANVDQWKKALAERDEALKKAAQEIALRDRAAELLSTRLKAETGQADVCQAKHAASMSLAKDLIDDYASRHLRLCEPFTGLWKVGEEDRIQAFRNRLYEAQLDVPPAPPAPATPAPTANAKGVDAAAEVH